ncbi:hypothetical protein [Dialister hominis]|uniref:hypothetical protein n=2 Tax=Dialister hominis TaxID=2582419 RepID=UPI003AB126BC
MTLLWKRRCAGYQLTSAVTTQMSHKLVYGAETAFPQGVSLGLWFSKGLITTDEVRLHGFELNLALEGKVSAELTDELHFVERSEV